VPSKNISVVGDNLLLLSRVDIDVCSQVWAWGGAQAPQTKMQPPKRNEAD